MILVILALISLSILAILFLILKDVRRSEYNVKNTSELSKQAEEKYLEEFPNYTSYSIKLEIEKIADILIDNQESNRYTELLREKAEKDDKIKELKNAVVEDVDIIKYNKGNLKAKVKYKDFNCKYSMVLNMSTVARGRVFLNNYLIYKEGLKT